MLLLAVAASRWVVADAHPEAGPSLASAALGCGWAALVFVVVSPRITRPSKSKMAITLLAGALLLSGPAVGLLVGAHDLSAGALTIALALTPVAVAIGLSSFGSGAAGEVAGRIWPGLAAVTGLLLVLVQPDLSDARNDVALLLAPTLTGLGGALFCTRATEPGAAHQHASAVALLGAALVFLVATAATAIVAHQRPSLSMPAIAYEGVLALLSLLSLGRLGATRWSSQFTWLPLLILLEGIVLVRPPVTVRWVAGLALLAIASVYLLTPREDDAAERPTTLLRE